MKKPIWITVIVLIFALGAGVAYVLRPPEQASGPLEAIPLNIEGSELGGETTASAAAASEAAAEPFAFEGLVLYAIAQEESMVRFSIDEVLRGNPTKAIGSTDQIAAELALNFDNPAESQVGLISINARTLATNNTNRNRMIQNEILDTAEYEFITFRPTSIAGLPEVINPGSAIFFKVIGDLTIRNATVEQTFEVTASLDKSGRLEGSGQTVILRSDYGLLIPNVPSVADVSDEVILEIDFVAVPK